MDTQYVVYYGRAFGSVMGVMIANACLCAVECVNGIFMHRVISGLSMKGTSGILGLIGSIE